MRIVAGEVEPKLVAIVGGSGAGKSWLSSQLERRLGDEASRLCLDDFYRDCSHLPLARRARLNFDHPRAIDWPLLEAVLGRCRAGLPVRIPTYDFRTHSRCERVAAWEPKAVVLIEGLWLLRRPSLRQLFDLTIYVECPEAVRAARRLERDVAERGRTECSVRAQWRQTVAPMHQQFVESQVRRADVIVASPLSLGQVEDLADRIRALLRSDA